MEIDIKAEKQKAIDFFMSIKGLVSDMKDLKPETKEFIFRRLWTMWAHQDRDFAGFSLDAILETRNLFKDRNPELNFIEQNQLIAKGFNDFIHVIRGWWIPSEEFAEIFFADDEAARNRFNEFVKFVDSKEKENKSLRQMSPQDVMSSRAKANAKAREEGIGIAERIRREKMLPERNDFLLVLLIQQAYMGGINATTIGA